MIDNLITEGKRAGSIDNIINSSSLIYAHLMKFISVRPILPGWIGTIIEQSDQLAEINNAGYWRDVMNDPIRMERIKRQAINTYKKDGNKNAEAQFNIVHNDFYDIRKFRDKNVIKNYLISHLDPIKDQGMIDHIEEKFR